MKPLLIALSLLAYQAATQELSSTLHSTIYGAQIAFVDEMVVFTCVVRGSNSMSWTSDEYIGSDRRLPLSSGQLVNHSISAIGNAQTVAVLVDVTAGVVIKSELHIRVQSSFPLASVQCVDGSTNMNTSTSFLLVDATRVTCDRQTVCSGSTITCNCITGNSDSLAWMSNGNRLLFTSTDAVPTRRNVSRSNQFAVLTENSDMNGIRVIMSNFTINLSSNDSDIMLTCENVDRAMTEPIIIPVIPYENCLVNPTVIVTSTDPRTVVSTDPGNEIAPARNSCNRDGLIAAVVVLITVTLVTPVIVFIIVYKVLHKRFQEQLKESGQEIDNLREEKQRLQEQIENVNQEVQRKNTEIEAKEVELHRLQSDMDKMREEKVSVKQLKDQIKQKDDEIKKWKEEVDKKQKDLYNTDTQLATEKARLLEELIQEKNEVLKDALEKMESSMNKEHMESLKALKDIAKEGVEEVLSEGTPSVEKLETLKDHMIKEIDTTSRFLKSFLTDEIKTVLTRKGESERASKDKDDKKGVTSAG